MRYLPIAAASIVITILLFHIGQLNLRYNHVHEELNVCSQELSETKEEAAWKLEECEHNLQLNSEEVQQAIKDSTKYCRG